MREEKVGFATLLALALALALVGLAGCGAGSERESGAAGPEASLTSQAERAKVEWVMAPQPIPGVEQRIVGKGQDAAVILTDAERGPTRKTVIFLHPWQPLPPSAKSADIRRLVGAGNTVIYPVYQSADTPASALRRHALAGIAAGLAAVDFDPRGLIAIGYTTGGAIAFDYSALAVRRGLPRPRGVIAIFPGREPGGRIPPADLSAIDPNTWLVAATGTANPIPGGEAEARALLAGATAVPRARRRLHRYPNLSRRKKISQAEARQIAWRPVERLLRAVRGERVR